MPALEDLWLPEPALDRSADWSDEGMSAAMLALSIEQSQSGGTHRAHNPGLMRVAIGTGTAMTTPVVSAFFVTQQVALRSKRATDRASIGSAGVLGATFVIGKNWADQPQ